MTPRYRILVQAQMTHERNNMKRNIEKVCEDNLRHTKGRTFCYLKVLLRGSASPDHGRRYTGGSTQPLTPTGDPGATEKER